MKDMQSEQAEGYILMRLDLLNRRQKKNACPWEESQNGWGWKQPLETI